LSYSLIKEPATVVEGASTIVSALAAAPAQTNPAARKVLKIQLIVIPVIRHFS
jgi:hypothetical protein